MARKLTLEEEIVFAQLVSQGDEVCQIPQEDPPRKSQHERLPAGLLAALSAWFGEEPPLT
jgi:hypothetical protein